MLSNCSVSRASAILFEIVFGLFLLGLLLIVWLPPQSQAGIRPGETASNLLPAQGTPIAETVNGSIDGSEPAFTGQALLASGIPSDKNCRLDGNIGTRFYDETIFFNASSQNQTVSIGFTSSCGTNAYIAAYYQQFDPAKICENFIASPGNLGSAVMEFTVCPNSQFSIIVYGVVPGSTCGGYTYNVFGDGIARISSPSREANGAASPDSILPAKGTPLVTIVFDGIDQREPTFTGRAQAFSPVTVENNCRPGGTGAFFYDEFFFINNSSTTQAISVNSSFGACSGNIIMAAYSPQFNPADVCQNFLSSNRGSSTWDFTVCPNSMFSIVAYGPLRCSNYFFQVFGNNITFLGKVADLAISKTGPSSPVPVGSNITYTIRVTNNGPNVMSGVTVKDQLPAGATFVALNNIFGAGVLCSTPPVGSNGTVTCNTGRIFPSPFPPDFASFSIVVKVDPNAPSLLANTATLSSPGIDPNSSNDTSTSLVTLLNTCLQDPGNGNILSFNSNTGDYKFVNCRKNITLTGRGTLTINGCKITLQDRGPDPKRPDRNVQVNVSTCSKEGMASVQIASQGTTFTISDRDFTNNTCACR